MNPFCSMVDFSNGKITDYHNKTVRKLSDMKYFFFNREEAKKKAENSPTSLPPKTPMSMSEPS